MANSVFSKIVKSLWVFASFITCLNGLGFAYIGAKEFKANWIKEGLLYELPWFLVFLSLDYEGISTFFVILGFLLQLVSIVRSFMVYTKDKDILIGDDSESQIVVEKSISSFWVIFSVIPYLNGVGIAIFGAIKGVKNWILEGVFYELLWIFVFIAIFYNINTNFPVSIGMIGLIISIIRTFMIYFEEEKMDSAHFDRLNAILDTPNVDYEPKAGNDNVSSDSEIIPQFIAYDNQIHELKNTFNQKEENITNLINKNFNQEELSYDRFTSVIKNCHKIFYHQADSASNIIHLAPEYTLRLDESVKGKISIMEGIIEEMNNLIEEFILHEGNDEQSEADLDELFNNMDNLISSVKDYR